MVSPVQRGATKKCISSEAVFLIHAQGLSFLLLEFHVGKISYRIIANMSDSIPEDELYKVLLFSNSTKLPLAALELKISGSHDDMVMHSIRSA